MKAGVLRKCLSTRSLLGVAREVQRDELESAGRELLFLALVMDHLVELGVVRTGLEVLGVCNEASTHRLGDKDPDIDRVAWRPTMDVARGALVVYVVRVIVPETTTSTSSVRFVDFVAHPAHQGLGLVSQHLFFLWDACSVVNIHDILNTRHATQKQAM